MCQGYVSPLEKALGILAGRVKVPRCEIASARKIVSTERVILDDLDIERAPYRIVRWVAWGADPVERRRRADLAIHLRHVIETARSGWLDETQLRLGLEAYQQARDDAQRCGRAHPRPADVPVSVYEAAIRSAPRPSQQKAKRRLRERRAGAELTRALAPYRALLPAELLAEVRDRLADALLTHPVVNRVLERGR